MRHLALRYSSRAKSITAGAREWQYNCQKTLDPAAFAGDATFGVPVIVDLNHKWDNN
jgi:hypothetical protein